MQINIMKDVKNIIIALLIITAFILLRLYGLEKEKVKEKDNLIEASADTLHTWKNKYGQNMAKIQVLESQNTKDFINMKSKDSLIIRLQEEVKRQKKYLKDQGSVTIIDTKTEYDTIFKNINNEFTNLFGTYISSSVNNKWIDANFGIKLDSLPKGGYKVDSTVFSLKMYNSYSLTIGKEKTGFLGLGKGRPFAELTNENPYTSTTALRTYQVSQPAIKRIVIGPVAAYGAHTQGLDWFLGIGVMYKAFEF